LKVKTSPVNSSLFYPGARAGSLLQVLRKGTAQELSAPIPGAVSLPVDIPAFL